MRTQTGIFERVTPVFVPVIARQLKSYLLKTRGEFSHLYEIAENQDANPNIRVAAYKWIDMAGIELLHDLRQCVREPKPEAVDGFTKVYGMTPQSALELMAQGRLHYRQLLQPCGIINYSDDFVFTLREPRGDVIAFNAGPALSIERGSIVVNNGTPVFVQGLDIYFNRSQLTQFERQLMRDLIRSAFLDGDAPHARQLLDEEMDRLESGAVPREELVKRIDPGFDFTDYSFRYRGERAETIRQQQLKKGEEYEYGYALRNGEAVEVPASAFLAGAPIAVDRYKEDILDNGRAADVVRALFPEVHASRRAAASPGQLRLFK